MKKKLKSRKLKKNNPNFENNLIKNFLYHDFSQNPRLLNYGNYPN